MRRARSTRSLFRSMFLPIGDMPNPASRQVVNVVLIGLNVAIFLLISLPLSGQPVDLNDPLTLAYVRTMSQELGLPASALLRQASAYDVFIFHHGFRPSAASALTLLTSMFLHSGWLHLAGNMLFLWIFGDNVEHHLGRARYALVYVLTGVCATLFFALFRWGSNVPLVGASGAISGVLGCYFMWFPHNRVRVLMVLIWFVDVIAVPARWVLGFYVVVDNLLPFLFGAGGGVAHGAHLGGFLGGLGIAAGLDRLERGISWPQRIRGYRVRSPAGVGVSPTEDRVGAFARLVGEESMPAALSLYAGMDALSRARLPPEALFRLVDWLTEQGRFSGALAILQRHIAQRSAGDAVLARAHLRAGLLQLRGLGRPTAAYQHLLTVLDLHPSAEVERAARDGLDEIARGGRMTRH